CCTVTDFKVQLNSQLRSSLWNIHASSVFARSFIEEDKYPNIPQNPNREKLSVVKDAFFTCLSNIRSKWSKEANDPEEQAQEKASNAAMERKRNRYNRRREVCQRLTSFNDQLPYLEQLGAAGMSSDEWVANGEHTELVIIEPEWRSTVVTLWLRGIDYGYDILRHPGNQALPGARP
ncbi:hypothetical protein K474DRAFT_1563900, partial [Panus rudis PR-1116 ss-1]